ncbi:hypothetical protein ABGB12_04510 [Actinocorallia sp. B10E7]|uniref:hypothetical protein n=1 Tax=Actinocorallia sp. B10E7 TaxID=3153558 RepID=UPI00325E691D
MTRIRRAPLPAEEKGASPPLSPAPSAFRLRRHRAFVAVLTLGALLRIIAGLGYRPALWFNDSYDYVQIALQPFPHPIRPAGYGIFLWLLRPFHSFELVVAVQHLLGLATGLLVYLLLSRRGLPPWGAALAAAPVLLDGGIIELESLILSDTLFLFLSVAALTALLWPGGHHPVRLAAAGTLLAAATTTRTIGLPLLLLALAWLLLRRRWGAVGLVAVTGLLPLAVYASWFHSENGRYGITATDGVFLWGRTAAFVRCENIPEELRYLCPAGEPGERKASSSQVWAPESPIGWRFGEAFDPRINEDAQRFAVRAVLEQPFDYAKTVAYDFFVRTFRWERDDHPTAVTARKYLFPERAEDLPVWPVLGGGAPADVVTAYDPDMATNSGTRIVEPYAGIMRFYQGFVTVRGPVLALALLLPAYAWYRRRSAPPALLPWAAGVALLAVPPLTVDFDHRYALTAMPIIALAAGCAFARTRETAEGTAGPPVISLPAPRRRPPF